MSREAKALDANGFSQTYGAAALRRAIDDGWAAATQPPWTEPDWSLLDDRRGALPEFPLDALPACWRDWVARSARGAGVTPAHVAVPLLGIASSQIGGARRAQASRAWSEPMTLWVAVVGFSGSGKTPGIEVTARALARIQDSHKSRVAELQRRHETRAETARAARKKWKADLEAAIAAGQGPPPQPPEADEVGPFVAPRVFVSNATIERLTTMLDARPRGLLALYDELAGLFANMGRYSGGSDRAFWLQAWNGSAYTVERMGRPPVALANLLIGLVGGFQPDKLTRAFDGDADGMYARMCFCWPAEAAYAPLSDDVAEIEPDTVNALARLIGLEAGEPPALVPRSVPLSAAARAAFETFRRYVDATRLALDGREREWCAKGGSHVLRLAGTLVFLEWSMAGGPEPAAIEAPQMAAAVRLWTDYFWPHSRAALRQIGLTERHTTARRVLRWIAAKGVREIGIKDIRRDALSGSIDRSQTEELLRGLEQTGWLRKETTASGGRPVHRWQVNPALLDGRRRVAETAESAERVP
jgi:hypothetical protein